MTATCRHCRRPIVRTETTWLHTDGLPDCLDEWRWNRTGMFAEPVQTPTAPRRRRFYNDVRNAR